MNELEESAIRCPYCGEPNTVLVEDIGEDQEYIEDCQVCCRPIVIGVSATPGGEASVSVRAEDETF
ncbi:MAG: CPXCG motif-containing cysteine-rich protein [Halioglobus sp.]|nr:CPXCG motif-containing cysteine-rich protein [Halioglobus sp.]